MSRPGLFRPFLFMKQCAIPLMNKSAGKNKPGESSPIQSQQSFSAPSLAQVWAMGYKGQGVVIAGEDTGYQWEHPALKNTYRGWDGTTADHNYNWHDAIHEISPLHNDPMPDPSLNSCGLDVQYPCDDGSHGTHTMGTMIGEEGPNQIGVAPGAKWMACRNMERGYGSPTTYIECLNSSWLPQISTEKILNQRWLRMSSTIPGLAPKWKAAIPAIGC